MTTEVQGGVVALGYQRVATNALWKLLSEHITATLSVLMSATNPRHLRSLINQALLDYASVRAVAGGVISGEAVEKHQTAHEMIVEINESVFEALINQGIAQYLSRKDIVILLTILREQASLALLIQEVPEQNQPAFYKALIDGYWIRQKLDMAISAAMLVATKELVPEREEIAHWLCLAAKQFFDEWETIFFSNNPVFHERLSKPLEDLQLISLEEWERELGI